MAADYTNDNAGWEDARSPVYSSAACSAAQCALLLRPLPLPEAFAHGESDAILVFRVLFALNILDRSFSDSDFHCS
uniref:Uncharacterized protein n=1 Tax=Oryza sativa subsp. japonica TaxID=39947 RepID=Q6H877_ORYSJ|nr:hypothetical protein [Oryza sativa Japonica Group]